MANSDVLNVSFLNMFSKFFGGINGYLTQMAFIQERLYESSSYLLESFTDAISCAS